MAKLLKLSHLINENRVADVQVGRGWIEACLDNKRPVFLELFREAVFRKNFVCPAGKLIQLIFDAGHYTRSLILIRRQRNCSILRSY